MFATEELLWALIGLILTIGGMMLEVFITDVPWHWGTGGIEVASLGVSWQIGAVLLIGCLAGKNAATLSQVAYLSLGLLPFDLHVFTEGGGLSYLWEPSFGYLLGFVPAGWVCGYLAFVEQLKLEHLAFSCLGGLATIHGVGLIYLPVAYVLQWTGENSPSLATAIFAYSIAPMPAQLIVVCAVSVLAYGMRKAMFY